MFDMDWYELIGFIASFVIAVSLMMKNVFWLRVINLIGSLVFTVYGILIHSVPVAAMNAFIVCIDSYYLARSFHPDYFKVLQVEPGGYYLRKFLDFYQAEINKFMPEFDGQIHLSASVYFILCNMVPAGLLITEERDGNLWITLDFAIPDYQDFKLGKFVYTHQAEIFNAEKYDQVFCAATTPTHQRYLKRMGFRQYSNEVYALELHSTVHRIEKDLI
ncbi:MAG: YgjV family protein [Anaerolineaceae bacterium]|nr:YgjV family protein [Anaerolineaceae bacterium]